MTKKIIFWVVIAGALIAAWYFLYYKKQAPAEGSLCNGGYGKITNGVCVGCGYYRTATQGPTQQIPKPC